MKRVFYSAFIHVNEDEHLPARTGDGPPLLREHRLYQADWLLRYYGFEAKELLSEKNPNFNVLVDPKCNWAMEHLPNASRWKSIELIIICFCGFRESGINLLEELSKQQRMGNIDLRFLKKMGVVLKRALYFLTCNGKMMKPGRTGNALWLLQSTSCRGKTAAGSKQSKSRISCLSR